nr:Uncharacterised protein [Raoultella sp. NCTC 9187]
MDYDEDKVGLKLNALELAVVDLVVDGHLGEQHMGSWERHREGSIKNPARWPGVRNGVLVKIKAFPCCN